MLIKRVEEQAMVTGTLRRIGDGYVVDVPNETVERYGLREGQDVEFVVPGEAAPEETLSAEAEQLVWRELARRSLAKGWTEADRAYDQLL